MTRKLKGLLMVVLLLYGSPLYSQSNYGMADGYSVIIRGGSNIRDWAESAEEVSGIASINWIDDLHFDISEVRILISANAIKSMGVEGNIMNKKTYETLKTDQYPSITFMVTSPVKSVVADGKKRFVEASGGLTIAGITKVTSLHSIISADRQGRVNIEGNLFLKMSDFGIEPPVTLFGLLSLKDSVTVDYKMSLIPDKN